jgi:hypothetical protein
LTGTDLTKADLRHADLTNAFLINSVLTGANLHAVNLDSAVYEIQSGAQPDIPRLVSAKRVYKMQYRQSPHAMVELREAFKKAGMRELEREVTYAKIQSDRTWENLDNSWKKFENQFHFVFFDLTCQYGMSPGRPLRILGSLIFVFWVVCLRTSINY